MAKSDIGPYRRNLRLKREFELENLCLGEVFEFTPLDLDLENRRLESLLDFVRKYWQYASRETMELVEGDYCFPPIFPGLGPDSDWYRFELWLWGKRTHKTITEQLPATFTIKNPDDIPEEEIAAELEKLLEAVCQAGHGISLNDGIPARLVFRQVMEWIGEKFALSGPGGGWTFNGCSGYCPDCFQRPWCGMGCSSCWQEDEAAGKMHLTEELKDFVCASPQSLDILQKLQAEEDGRHRQWKAKKKDPGFGDFEENGDWKAKRN